MGVGQSTKKIKQNIKGRQAQRFQLHLLTLQIRQVSKGRRWVMTAVSILEGSLGCLRCSTIDYGDDCTTL